MNEQNTKRNIFKNIIVPLLLVVLYIAIQFAGSFLGIVLVEGEFITENLENPILATFLGQTIALVAMIAILIPYLKKRQRREPATVMAEPMNKNKVLQGILFGFVGIGIMIVTNVVLQPLFLSLFPAADAEDIDFVIDTLPLGLILLNYLNSAVLAPIAEELTFRHTLLGALKPQNKTRRFLPYLYTALIFAATHMSLSQVLPPTFLGLLLAHVYVTTRSIWPAVIAHGVINALMGATLVLLPEAAVAPYLIGMAVLSVIALIVLIVQRKKNQETALPQAELA